MKFSRILLVALVILGVVGLTFAAVNRRPPVNIVKAPILDKTTLMVTTGLQGTITVQGSLPTQLKSMTCADLKVFVGKWVTPPPPPGGIAIGTFQESASAAASGAIPSCSYKVTNVPAGQEFEVMVNANQQKFACDQTTLNTQPAQTKLTFTKGKMETRNFQVTPNCAIIK